MTHNTERLKQIYRANMCSDIQDVNIALEQCAGLIDWHIRRDCFFMPKSLSRRIASLEKKRRKYQESYEK